MSQKHQGIAYREFLQVKFEAHSCNSLLKVVLILYMQQ